MDSNPSVGYRNNILNISVSGINLVVTVLFATFVFSPIFLIPLELWSNDPLPIKRGYPKYTFDIIALEAPTKVAERRFSSFQEID